jgi:hypothetical protein
MNVKSAVKGMQFDHALGAMRVVLAGRLSVEDLEAAFLEMLEHPQFRPGMPIIWDLRTATLVTLSTEHLRRLSGRVSTQRARRGTGKAAIVVGSDVDYGLMRQFEVLSEGVPRQLMVFRELAAAEAWLGAD